MGERMEVVFVRFRAPLQQSTNVSDFAFLGFYQDEKQHGRNVTRRS
jgi:hypothetical protein